MRLKLVGAPGRPVALFVHPALQDASFFDPLVDALHGDFRVALPTLDGHYPGAPDFDDARTQASRLDFHLRAEHVGRVEVLLSCGVGVPVALWLMAGRPALVTGKAVLDGGTLSRGTLRALSCRHGMERLASRARADPARARNLVDSRDAALVDAQVRVASKASRATVAALAEASFPALLPELAESLQVRTTFLWGAYDQNGSAHARVARAYPAAHVRVVPGWGALGLLRADPEGYARAYLL